METDKSYWQNHVRHVDNGRLTWYSETADESFWFDYWQKRVNANYFAVAETLDLAGHELGRVLLSELGGSLSSGNGRHLEAGCGAGYWVAVMRRAGLNVEGIEYSAELVKLVQAAYPQLPVCLGDALAIDCPDNTYASYLSFGVVEHRREGPEPFLVEAHRVLRPGGKLIITVPYFGAVRRAKARLHLYADKQPELPFFQYGFDTEEFTGLIRNAGFQVNDARPLFVHRLLLEESAFYRRLALARGNRFLKRFVQRLLNGRDGHMLLIVADKVTG